MENEFRFTMPFNVVVKDTLEGEEISMEGFISTTHKDLVNDVVTKKCLESMKAQIMDRNIKLDLEHEAFRGETKEQQEINKTKIPVGRLSDAIIEQVSDNNFGLRVKSVLNRFNESFEKVRGNVVNKFLDAYSIAFIPTEIKEEIVDGEKIRFLDDVRLLNVALTGNPCNTKAQINEVFMKSMDAVEEYKREKLTNPEIANKLEVKAQSKKPKPQPDPHKEPEEEEDEVEKKPKKKCSYEKEKQLNPMGGKIMEKENEEAVQEQPLEEPVEVVEEVAKEEAPVEAPVEKPVEAPAEPLSEIKSLKDRLATVEKELNEFRSKPIHKAMATPQSKEVKEQKSQGPLDMLK